MNEEKIAQLEAQLTGDMFADMDIKNQIHKLKLEEAGGSATLMILSVKPVDHKKKDNQNRKREAYLSCP